MNLSELEKIVNETFENKDKVNTNSDKSIANAINETIELTDQGKIRVAEKKNGSWKINQWIKKAILLSFKINKMEILNLNCIDIQQGSHKCNWRGRGAIGKTRYKLYNKH